MTSVDYSRAVEQYGKDVAELFYSVRIFNDLKIGRDCFAEMLGFKNGSAMGVAYAVNPELATPQTLARASDIYLCIRTLKKNIDRERFNEP